MKLRAFQESDWPRAAMLFMSREVNKTYMLPDFESAEKARPLFDRLMGLSKDEKRYVRAMEEGGRFVGFLNDVEREDNWIEVGYAVCPDAWGKGNATAALKIAIEDMFRLGFSWVVAGAFVGNDASLRVMEKAGMTPIEKVDDIEYRGKVHKCVYRAVEKK